MHGTVQVIKEYIGNMNRLFKIFICGSCPLILLNILVNLFSRDHLLELLFDLI